MCKMFRKLLAFVLLMPLVIYGQYERPGSTSAQFLKIDVSPRAAAMGHAYISVSDGAEGTVYNPAALAWIRGTDVVFTHTNWFAGINHEFAAIAHNMPAIGCFGVSVTALYTDEMDVTTPLQPDGTGETFYASNYRFGLSYARFLTDRVTIGLTANYIHLALYSDFKESAVSMDIAAYYVTEFRDFKFGMEIANFGSSIRFVDETYPLPGNFTFGMSMNALERADQELLVSLAGVKPNDGQPLAQIGTEWNYDQLLFLRGGYRLNHDVESYSFGGGLQFDVARLTTRFDYSYSDYDLLGATHRIGIGINL
ncbi:MAG: PorV/PorQ family protein [Caldithrix sp.]|nr:PorV/PorQ family protein [Caldithrix sp.]